MLGLSFGGGGGTIRIGLRTEETLKGVVRPGENVVGGLSRNTVNTIHV